MEIALQDMWAAKLVPSKSNLGNVNKGGHVHKVTGSKKNKGKTENS